MIIMPQRISPSTKIKVVPKDGEIEITLNVNISVDGAVTATAPNANVSVEKEDDAVEPLIPDFSSGSSKIFGSFGKKSKEEN